ncbi:MAG TPA: type II toxin-antitoxin system PemK/MazF family toxin [Pedococcus sp.]|jgi:hypothetical protein|uniref:type II toxin-antitoxin system PemK/MazF family toxin n=1 Tax=Pedococcus sp. TaxID=2860345 RepID=UPI002F9254A7
MARPRLGSQLAHLIGRAAEQGARALLRGGRRSGAPSRQGAAAATAHRTGPATTSPPGSGAYPGDFLGTPGLEYQPEHDGQPDPGEIVWTWVPYEEDPSQGKDRPVLLVGRDGPWLLALMLTSRDHDRDAADELRHGRQWVDIGTGPWDRRGRPSEVRVDRVIRIDPTQVRREGAVLDRRHFDRVAAAVRGRGR